VVIRAVGTSRRTRLRDAESCLEPELRSVLRCVRPASPVRSMLSSILGSSPPSASIAVLLFPRWAEEECGAVLPLRERRRLVGAQAHLLAAGLLRDRIADGENGAVDDLPDLLPLWLEAHSRLAGLFPQSDPFWVDFRRLVREQASADRWERTNNQGERFERSLLRRLGQKTAVLRWPAAAVARRLRRPRIAQTIERFFDDLLTAFQILDDVVDAREDAATGQINAVLVAAAAAPGEKELPLDARILRAIPSACREARLRLARVSARPGSLGRFARSLLDGFDDNVQKTIDAVRARAVCDILEGITAGSAS
jgi:hypothetical protein